MKPQFAAGKVIVSNRHIIEQGDHHYPLAHVVLYKSVLWRTICTWLLFLSTAGLAFLLAHWFPVIYMKLSYEKCTTIEEAEYVAVYGENLKFQDIILLKRINVGKNELNIATGQIQSVGTPDMIGLGRETKQVQTYTFEYLCSRYILHPSTKEFEYIRFDLDHTIDYIYENYSKGIPSDAILKERQEIYGPGCMEIPMPPLYESIIKEVLRPVYVFQTFAFILWFSDQYFIYASTVLTITVFSLAQEIYDTRKNTSRFRKLASCTKLQNILVPKDSIMARTHPHVHQKQPSPNNHLCASDMEDYDRVVVSKDVKEIVPGDVAEISYGVCSCDMILLEGSVLVNEGMLSGESIPRLKTALKTFPGNATLSSRVPRGHYQGLNFVLYSGTEVVQIKATGDKKPLGLVIRSGFSTAQGHMLSTLLRPLKNRSNRFVKETYKFLGALAILATVGASFSAYVTISYHLRPAVVFIRFFDTFTNIIPPVLPATMAVGCSFAVERLRRYRKVLCFQTSFINITGEINTLVIDKTGTLTQENLSVDGFATTTVINSKAPMIIDVELQDSNCVSSTSGEMSKVNLHEPMIRQCTTPLEAQNLTGIISTDSIARDSQRLANSVEVTQIDNLIESPSLSCIQSENENSVCKFIGYIDKLDQLPSQLVEALACCNTLSYWNGDIVGDLMEIQLLKYSQWTFFELATPSCTPEGFPFEFEVRSPDSNCVLQVLRRFEFRSEIQRMSVVVYHKQLKSYFAYCKGSTEQLELRCIPLSIPVDYHKYLHSHTKRGKRVLAYGAKRIDHEIVASLLKEDGRDEVESQLQFLGFVFLMNHLKPDSREVVTKLRSAGVSCLMATGDDPVTALAIARECNMLDITAQGTVLLGKLHRPQSSEKSLLLKCQNEGGSISTSDMKTNSSSTEYTDTCEHLLPSTLIWKVVTFDAADNLEHYNVHISSSRKRSKSVIPSHKPRSWSTSTITTFSELTSQVEDVHLDDVDKLKTVSTTNETLLNTASSTPMYSEAHLSLVDKSTSDDSHASVLSTKQKSLRMNSSKSNQHLVPESQISYRTLGITTEDEDQYLTTAQLIKLLGEVDDLSHSGITLALTGAALRYLYTACNSTADYNIILKSENPNQQSFPDLGDNYVTPKTDVDDQFSVDIEAQSKNVFPNNYHGVPPQSCDMNITNEILTTSGQMSLFEYCLRCCRVYSRMTPQDKAFLIQKIQVLKGSPVVGMCGDGANDCEALKYADVGLSLSGDVTSICAHVTSTTKSIQSIHDVMCEGRGALVSSFSSCKFVILYALIQFTSSLILYSYGGNLTDEEYTFIDIVLILPLAVSNAWTHGGDKVTQQLPLSRLIGPSVLVSLIGQFFIQLLFMLLPLVALVRAPFYKRYEPDSTINRFEAEDLECYENTTVFLASAAQYIITSLLMTGGRPWRKSRFSNPWYVLSMIFTTTAVTLVYFASEALPHLQIWLGLVNIPLEFRARLGGFLVANFLASYLFEKYFVSWVTAWEIKKQQVNSCLDHSSYFRLALSK